MEGKKRSPAPGHSLRPEQGFQRIFTSGLEVLQSISCLLRVLVEHLDGIRRILVQVFPDGRELVQHIIRDRDDVTAGGTSLEDVDQLQITD